MDMNCCVQVSSNFYYYFIDLKTHTKQSSYMYCYLIKQRIQYFSEPGKSRFQGFELKITALNVFTLSIKTGSSNKVIVIFTS